jgi:DNA-binding MarR family transcriptional regulator
MKDDAVEALVRQLYGLGAIRRHISQHALAELGTQGFTALGVIRTHGPLRVSQVADQLGVDLSVASRQVAALSAAGYVGRSADASDRRAQLISISDRGDRALADAHRRMVAAFGDALEDWPEPDVASLAVGIARLRESFGTEVASQARRAAA